MSTLHDQYRLAQDDAFVGRVTIAAITAAQAVLAEPDPSPERASYAARVLRNPTGSAQTLALAVAATADVQIETSGKAGKGMQAMDAGEPSTVTTTMTDEDIAAAVQASFGAMASAAGAATVRRVAMESA